MKNYSNIAIVASFFALWMDSYLSVKLQITAGFFLIFTFGILHGANDLMLIDKVNVGKKNIAKLKILIFYTIVVLFGLILFFIIPKFALLLFIVISANHFGEQQWQGLLLNAAKWFVISFQFFYGLTILLLLFVFHTNEVQSIILSIANLTIPISYFLQVLQVSIIVFLCLCGYLLLKNPHLIKTIVLEFFYLILFAIIFKSSSLIWGFAIYFVVWHSIPSLIDQIKFLNGSFSIKYFIEYCRSAGIYWFVSIIGLALFYYILKEEQLFNALFFSFLAAITFPHTVVIAKMFKRNKS